MSDRKRQLALNGFEDIDEDPPTSSSDEAAKPDAKPPRVDPAPVEPTLAGKTVYIVDSHSLIFQVFHAIRDMTGPQGQPVAAIFGFARDLLDLLGNWTQQDVPADFDGGGVGATDLLEMLGNWGACP